MKIKVLGPGCVNCKVLHETTKQALDEMGIEAELEHPDLLVRPKLVGGLV